MAKKEERSTLIAKSNGKQRRTNSEGSEYRVDGYIVTGGYQPIVQTSGTVQPPRVGTTAVIPVAKSTAKQASADTDEK